MNTITLKGRAGNNPETFRFSDGNEKVTFSIADSSQPPGVEGKTTWFQVEARKDLADAVLEKVRRGIIVIVQGRLRIDTYTNKEGVLVRKLIVRLAKFKVLEEEDTGKELWEEAS